MLRRLFFYFIYLLKYISGKYKPYYKYNGKSRFSILTDLLYWLFKEHEFNHFYFAFGLDKEDTNISDFIGRYSILKLKKEVEQEMLKHYENNLMGYDIIVKDKFIFNSFLTGNGISCIPQIGLLNNGKLILNGGIENEIDYLFTNYNEWVIKILALESGEGVFICKVNNDFIEVNNDLLSLSDFILKFGSIKALIQNRIYSHDEIRKIAPSALNTTRIVTIKCGNEIQYLGGFQCFSVGSAKTDSWQNGSVYVGIDAATGCLKKYAISSIEDEKPGIMEVHPVSNFRFSNLNLPFWRESMQLCLKAHRLLYNHFLIGWDIAITNKGPVIVEANEKPGMNAVQCFEGGLRSRIFNCAAKVLINL